MDADRIRQEIESADPTGEPAVQIITRSETSGPRLGIFASSFNPPTVAHLELIHRSAQDFGLDEILALAGNTNADKLQYECSLEDRLAMMTLAFSAGHSVSIGVSSHAFYVDMVDALERAYPPQTDLHFIVGFDTFERVLDFDDRYTGRYYRRFGSRDEALRYLFSRSRFIVASRAGAGVDSIQRLVDREPAVPPGNVLFLDFPADLGELSATEVRNRRRVGDKIIGLVPASVEKYIQEHGVYKREPVP